MNEQENMEQLQQIYEKAVAAHEHGEIAEAIILYETILPHISNGDLLYYNLGLACYQHGDFAKAVDSFEKAIAINDQDNDYWFNLALACKKKKDFQGISD